MIVGAVATLGRRTDFNQRILNVSGRRRWSKLQEFH
jgi:hypothetical protein